MANPSRRFSDHHFAAANGGWLASDRRTPVSSLGERPTMSSQPSKRTAGFPAAPGGARAPLRRSLTSTWHEYQAYGPGLARFMMPARAGRGESEERLGSDGLGPRSNSPRRLRHIPEARSGIGLSRETGCTPRGATHCRPGRRVRRCVLMTHEASPGIPVSRPPGVRKKGQDYAAAPSSVKSAFHYASHLCISGNGD